MSSGPNAMDYINAVRQRAAGSGTTGKPENLSSLTMNDIMLERRVELALEGHYFYDLLRWGILNDSLDARYYASLDTTFDFEEGIDEFLPWDTAWVGTNPDSVIDAVKDFSKASFELYPNPGNGSIDIRSNEIVSCAKVYNISGVVVMEKEIADQEDRHIDITNLRSGIYIKQIQTDLGIQTRRYIKQ
jgi:hypothetical protein